MDRAEASDQPQWVSSTQEQPWGRCSLLRSSERSSCYSGWRAVFIFAGAAGLAWVVWWGLTYRPNLITLSSNTLDARALGSVIGWKQVVSQRNVQSFVFAKFMSDSAWYFLLFWLPKYLYDARGFDIKQVSYYAWIPYAASGLGSFIGGWLRRGCYATAALSTSHASLCLAVAPWGCRS